MTIEELREAFETWNAEKQAAAKQAPCHSCGRCPSCGRGGYEAAPWVIPMPYWHHPQPYYPTWVSCGTTTGATL